MEIRIRKTREIIIGFLVIAIFFFLYSDQIVEYINTLPPLVILFASTLLSPVYVLFIYLLYKSYGLSGAIGGFLISTASDIISLPHVLFSKTGEFSGPSYNLITDSIFYNLLPDSLKHVITLPFFGEVNLAVFLVYIVISTSLVVLALLIVSKKRFKEIFKKSI